MRIGIIGGGVSGMTAAWLLQHDHHVTLMEAAPILGGHVQTIAVSAGDATVRAELGPRFFFESAYPYFLGLLDLLEVPIRWNDAMVSFTDVALRQTVVLSPRSPHHLASLLRSPHLARHVVSLRRLVGEQAAIAAGRDFSVTLRAHLALRGYPATFGPAFAYPFLAACWGAPLEQIPEFPVYSLLKGMPPGRRPGFFEVEGGMSRYVEAFARSLTHVDVRLGATVARVERAAAQLVVVERSGCRTSFDRVIVATSSRDAAGLLRRMPNTGGLREMRAMGEMQALSASFRHFDTDIVIHGDKTYMPEDPRDWAHNNLFFDGDAAWMTDWQGIRDRVPVFRTWVPLGYAPPTPLYGRRSFHHLVMTPDNALLQRRIAGVQGALGVWLTGMYAVDVDNHESALLSALVPAQALAPRSENLRRLLGAVAPSAPHGLDVLPLPLGVPSKQQQDRPFASLSTR